jgi:xanthine dehydrogenase YagR molybdenum-binding subunit
MSSSIIGAPVTRIDGPLKVTGKARYAVDHPMDNIVFGFAVSSTIAKGRIVSIDTSIAERMPGVLAIIHHGNSDPLFHTAGPFEPNSRTSETTSSTITDNLSHW